MRLALRLGRTLNELGQTMSSEEFELWVALYQDEPWDETRADLRAGIIASTISNWAGMMRKEGLPPASPADYMPFLKLGEVESDGPEEPDPLVYFSQFQ